MSMFIVYAVALICAAEAAPNTKPLATSCDAAAEAPTSATGGAALLQLAGAVGKREAAKGDEEAEAELQKRSSANATEEKKPKGGGFDFGGDENEGDDDLPAADEKNDIDNANVNDVENSNLDTVKPLRKDLAETVKAVDLSNVENNEDESGKKDGFNFKNEPTDEVKEKVDNFDFGDGPIKIPSVQESEKAVQDLKADVRKAVDELSSVLKEAEASQEAIRLAMEKLETGSKEEIKKAAETVQKNMETAEGKVQEAQKELQDLQKEMAPPSASYLGCSPHAWLIFVACSLWLSH